jgi:hypothetical protein
LHDSVSACPPVRLYALCLPTCLHVCTPVYLYVGVPAFLHVRLLRASFFSLVLSNRSRACVEAPACGWELGGWLCSRNVVGAPFLFGPTPGSPFLVRRGSLVVPFSLSAPPSAPFPPSPVPFWSLPVFFVAVFLLVPPPAPSPPFLFGSEVGAAGGWPRLHGRPDASAVPASHVGDRAGPRGPLKKKKKIPSVGT